MKYRRKVKSVKAGSMDTNVKINEQANKNLQYRTTSLIYQGTE
jgi:hypothetical protein